MPCYINVKGTIEGVKPMKVGQKRADAVKSSGIQGSRPQGQSGDHEWAGGGQRLSWLLVSALPKTPRDSERVASCPQNGGAGSAGGPVSPDPSPVPGTQGCGGRDIMIPGAGMATVSHED